MNLMDVLMRLKQNLLKRIKKQQSVIHRKYAGTSLINSNQGWCSRYIFILFYSSFVKRCEYNHTVI